MLETTFMTDITEQVSVLIGDYHDAVREEAQLLLVCMCQRFLPPQINLLQEQLDLVQALRANLTMGWPAALNG